MNCNCFNCHKEMENGIVYSFEDFIFCGKSCLVKYLQNIGLAKLEIVKSQLDKIKNEGTIKEKDVNE